MDRRVRSLRCGAAAALLALGSGCIHIHTDGAKKADPADPAQQPVAQAGAAKPDTAGPVRQAAAAIPAPSLPAVPSFAKLVGKADRAAQPQAAQIVMLWHNRLAQLPDPTRNGAMGNGLVGQMFLFGPDNRFTPADGAVTVAMYDETPRNGAAQSAYLGQWRFEKEALKGLLSADETLGKNYTLFLPWPDYRPDIARVKMTVRYDPDHGHPVYALASVMTIDTSNPLGAPVWTGTTTTVPAAAIPSAGAGSPLGGPPPANLSAGGGMPAAPAGASAPIPIPRGPGGR